MQTDVLIMADRNHRFPNQGQGFGMMQGPPRFVQPGMQQFPTMQQQMMMGQGQPMMGQGQQMMGQGQPMMGQGQRMMAPGMYPVNMMGMRMPPTGAPPPYNKHMQDSFHNRKREITTGARSAGKSEEQIRKERQYQQQRDKLKHFGKPTAGGLDPNKLVDSIFGTSDKPKTKPANIKIPTEADSTDNGFGEFLSSPPASQTEQIGTGLTNDTNLSTSQSSMNPVTMTTTSQNTPLQQTHIPQPKEEKKDLEKMMFECSDLKAPQKAKAFIKPALKELHPTHHQSQVPTHHASQNARKWNQSEELSDLFIQEAVKDEKTIPRKPVPKHTSPTSKHPPKPPPWLSDETVLPEIYKHVLEASIVDGKISTERLYPILMLSGLPKGLMGHIWSLCNKATPGQLIKAELYQMLALIALAQNNYQVASVDILSRCPHPPAPRLQQAGSHQNIPQGPQFTPQGVQQGPQITSPEFQQGPRFAPQGLQQGPHIVEQGQQSVPQGPPVSPQVVAQGPQILQQGLVTQGQLTTTQGPHVSQQGQGVPGLQPQLPQTLPISSIPHVVSAPATLTVTQLPSAGVSQGMMGMTAITTEEDDFADFQAAPPTTTLPAAPQSSRSFGDLMSDVKGTERSPIKDQAKYLYSVPTPDDAAIAATLSPHDLQHSNVETFFGSDDSSEVAPTRNTQGMASHNSLDDDYFDGYKSADSKRSDSTSQFSTDQSENEDFKNFENYLDEFQKRKEQREKDTPSHRVLAKPSPIREVGSPSKVFPKLPQKLPEPGTVQLPSMATKSADEFTDFSDFQSVSVGDSKQTLGVKVETATQLKSSGSKAELIGDEDKYAALRVLDFSVPDTTGSVDLMGDAEALPESEDNWADFQNAAFDDSQTDSTGKEKIHNDMTSVSDSNKVQTSSSWADFESGIVGDKETEVELSVTGLSVPASTKATASEFNNNSVLGSESFSGNNLEPSSDDWANFQEGNDEDFSDFQSSTGDFSTLKTENDEEKPSSLVNVKKGELDKNEILGLFKVKSSPVTVLKSRDDDINLYDPPKKELPVFDDTKEREASVGDKHISPKRKSFSAPHLSEGDDDMMGPPPVDHFVDDTHDDFAAYSRGYDFDDMMMPPRKEEKEHKNIYGVYGVNQNLIVAGHRKDDKAIHIEKDIIEEDNDSTSSRDNETSRPKFLVGKENAEDSQSVSSLEFVMNKRVQNLKESESYKDLESADNQSVSSLEFGTFDNVSSKDILPESKSLDSLDLRKEDASDTNDSQENSDREKDSMDKEIADDVVLADLERVPSLPVIGDRYSNILHDIPGSDKHSYEWQRCLDNCCRMIKDANNIFNSVSSSAVCNEIIRSTQGSEYIQGIIEIYRVVCKITVSMKKSAIQTEKLQQLLKDIDLAWNNLAAFLVGGSIMPDSKSLDFSQGVIMDDDITAQYLACGVCLLSVDMKLKGGAQDNGNSIAKLTYGGRQYHSPCANLWINCVDSTLPALKLPELL